MLYAKITDSNGVVEELDVTEAVNVLHAFYFLIGVLVGIFTTGFYYGDKIRAPEEVPTVSVSK